MGIALQSSFDDLDTPLSQVTFVVVDVETTGGSPATCSLTEVAAARYRGGELLGTYQTLVRPDERIPPFITALTGISDAMVVDAPRVGEMLPSFLEFVGGAVLVGHNLRFDLSFLDHALVATGRDRLANATVDTLALARRLVRDMVSDCKLGTLSATLRLDHQPSHRALTDVLATGDLLHALLERAGSFGIVGLEELLALPRLVGHPQAAKLRLTVRLPHRPGVYWFTDAAGTVLYVGKATDLHTRVRSYFTGDGRRKIGRLLRQMHAIHHRVTPGPLSAAVAEGRLIRQWSPPFNQQGKVRRRAAPAPSPRRRHRRRSGWTAEELDGDARVRLQPLADRLGALSEQQRYEEAAAVRDEAERLRTALVGHRWAAAVESVGRMVVEVAGEGTVVLDGGVLDGGVLDGGVLEAGTDLGDTVSPVTGTPTVLPGTEEHCRWGEEERRRERALVARWLAAHSDRVRIVEVASSDGLALPADRIPSLTELCRRGPDTAPDGGQPAGSSAAAAWDTRISDSSTASAPPSSTTEQARSTPAARSSA